MSADGTASTIGRDISFSSPSGVAVDSVGNVYVTGRNYIRKGYPGPVAPVLSLLNHGTDSTLLKLNGLPTQSYVLQSAPTLAGPWQPISTNTTTFDGTLTYTDPTPSDGGSRFYRVFAPFLISTHRAAGRTGLSLLQPGSVDADSPGH